MPTTARSTANERGAISSTSARTLLSRCLRAVDGGEEAARWYAADLDVLSRYCDRTAGELDMLARAAAQRVQRHGLLADIEHEGERLRRAINRMPYEPVGE